MDTRKPANTQPGAMLEAEVVHRAAKELSGLEIKTVAELRELHRKDEQVVHGRNVWLRLPSQSSDVTFNYLLIVAGPPSVKPDILLRDFLATSAMHSSATRRAEGDLNFHTSREQDDAPGRKTSGVKLPLLAAFLTRSDVWSNNC